MSEPSLEGEELRKRGKRGVKNDNGQGKHVAQDEGDFVDESELKGALQIGVLKIADSTLLDVGARNGMDLKVEEDVINRVSALIWDTVADHWSEDLAMFSAHANRQKVQLDDVRLLTRRNPDLFQASCNLAGVSLPKNNGLHKKSQNVGRKRKKNDREELLSTPTPQSESKKSKNFTTSTPKINTNSLISQFPQEITPIRPFSANEIIIDDDANYQRLTTIQEKSDEIEEKQEDSFELDYDTTVLGTSMDEDHQRLEALVPECGEEEEVRMIKRSGNVLFSFYSLKLALAVCVMALRPDLRSSALFILLWNVFKQGVSKLGLFETGTFRIVLVSKRLSFEMY
uniref:Centromere protein S n=1 Tax=Caenorhabditis japonica TaxID=281687 RepID=A0A8R1DQ73_CAEJA